MQSLQEFDNLLSNLAHSEYIFYDRHEKVFVLTLQSYNGFTAEMVKVSIHSNYHKNLVTNRGP